MLRFAAERLVRMVVVVWAMSLITFALFWAIPSYDAAYTLAGGPTGANTPEVRAQIRRELGLDEPLPVQYVRLMGDVATLRVTNWARATVDRHNISRELLDRVPVTASLVGGAALLAALGGTALAFVAVTHPGGALDRAIGGLGAVLYSMPTVAVAPVLLVLLTVTVPLFPTGGYVPLREDPLGWLSHLLLPCTVAALPFIGFYTRLLRANMLDSIGEDWVITARAKGIRERRILLRHVLRAAAIPTLTVFALDFSHALGGFALYTEIIFGIDGVGAYAQQAVKTLDLPSLTVTVLYLGALVVALNTLADIAIGWLDPRTRRPSP